MRITGEAFGGNEVSPRAIAFDGMNIWVTSAVGNNVTRFRASDGANPET